MATPERGRRFFRAANQSRPPVRSLCQQNLALRNFVRLLLQPEDAEDSSAWSRGHTRSATGSTHPPIATLRLGQRTVNSRQPILT
eukprot:1036091-Rhodomonas_salina.1